MKCKTCKYRTIHNNKNVFIHFSNSEGQSCYDYYEVGGGEGGGGGHLIVAFI